MKEAIISWSSSASSSAPQTVSSTVCLAACGSSTGAGCFPHEVNPSSIPRDTSKQTIAFFILSYLSSELTAVYRRPKLLLSEYLIVSEYRLAHILYKNLGAAWYVSSKVLLEHVKPHARQLEYTVRFPISVPLYPAI